MQSNPDVVAKGRWPLLFVLSKWLFSHHQYLPFNCVDVEHIITLGLLVHRSLGCPLVALAQPLQYLCLNRDNKDIINSYNICVLTVITGTSLITTIFVLTVITGTSLIPAIFVS